MSLRNFYVLAESPETHAATAPRIFSLHGHLHYRPTASGLLFGFVLAMAGDGRALYPRSWWAAD